MLAVVFSVLIGWLPIYIAAVIGATLMVLTNCSDHGGCLSRDRLAGDISHRGHAASRHGHAANGSRAVSRGADDGSARPFGPWWVIGGLYLITAAGTMIIPTAALVVLMSPIVLSASGDLGVAPHTAMMAVAMAASASFTSPISHPANILVMGPGGYRFADYLKVGLPLTAVVFVVGHVDVADLLAALRPCNARASGHPDERSTP